MRNAGNLSRGDIIALNWELGEEEAFIFLAAFMLSSASVMVSRGRE